MLIYDNKIQWACPNCQSDLNDNFVCNQCNLRGYSKGGMLYLHRSDEGWAKCEIERNGWIARTKEVGLYGENEDHFFLPDRRPHLKEFYAESKAHIDAFLATEDLNGKVCVDIGASFGWVEAYILETYPEAILIALEVNDDHLCGLGRSQAIKDRLNVDFVSLVADMHHIPLKSGTVDVVFSVDALHHFRDMPTVFSEVQRVLKPGGSFYGINEPDRPVGTDEDEYVAQYAEIELRHQIIERRPTYQEYVHAGSDLNVRAINETAGLLQHIDTASLLLKGRKAALGIDP